MGLSYLPARRSLGKPGFVGLTQGLSGLSERTCNPEFARLCAGLTQGLATKRSGRRAYYGGCSKHPRKPAPLTNLTV